MDDTFAARLNMVESQVRTADVTDLRIQDAMRRIPREAFLPAARAYQAYADVEPEYAPGRRLLGLGMSPSWSSSPRRSRESKAWRSRRLTPPRYWRPAGCQ